jgi:hypothetical protein
MGCTPTYVDGNFSCPNKIVMCAQSSPCGPFVCDNDSSYVEPGEDCGAAEDAETAPTCTGAPTGDCGSGGAD